MFFHILKRDLKRKKTMNVILLLFIILATMFLASSVGALLKISGAVDEFMEMSVVPDYFVLALADSKDDEIADFLEDNELVSSYDVTYAYNLLEEDIEVLSCAQNPENSAYDRTDTLMLQAFPEQMFKVFSEDGEEITLQSGEIAIPGMEAKNNNLQVGDMLAIKVGQVKQEFKVAYIVKDCTFGTTYMGMKRLFISAEDFAKYEGQEGVPYLNIYGANSDDITRFKKELSDRNFSIISSIDGKSTVARCYLFDKLTSGIFIVVSVCLILIAFMVLRFTIVFTLQEDYREIGIMKAIGVREKGIRLLYLVKYFVISVVGAAIGLCFSFPFGSMLLKNAMVNIVMNTTDGSFLLHLFCAVLVVAVVLFFCYTSAGKLKKFSAIEAIRNGSNGERYQANHHLHLWKKKKMRPVLFLAVNDIFSSLKRFGILIVTFCLGTMLILLPLSAVHTLQDDDIIYQFGMCPSDAYVDKGDIELYVVENGKELLLADLEIMRQTLKEHGLSAHIGVDVGCVAAAYTKESEDSYSGFIYQEAGDWERSYVVLEGREPELENEIMVTDITMRDMGVSIGDTIYFKFSDGEREFVITGSFQTMMNMGEGFRVSRSFDMSGEILAGVFSIQVEADDMESDEVCQKLKEIFPDYEVCNTRGFLEKMLGETLAQLDVIMDLIVALVLVINSLVTILMMKTMIHKERGDIALLKCMGFSRRSLKLWQTVRIGIVLVLAILIGTILSNLLAPYIMGPIFEMMGGSQIALKMNPLEAYVVYPLLLLTVTCLSAYLCASDIKKVDLKEVNSME